MEITNFKTFTGLSTDQKLDRMKGIGGSDAAAVIGQSRYKTPLDVYQDKMGLGSEFTGNLSTALGDHLEGFIRSMYSNEIGVELIKPDSIFHKDYHWMRSNLDFAASDYSRVGEIKYTASTKGWGDEGTDEIPIEYLIQCAHNCIVAESHFGIKYDDFECIVLFGGFAPQIKRYSYKRNSMLESLIISHEKAFWFNHVEKKTPPNAISLKDHSFSVDQIIDEAVIADDVVIELYERHKNIKKEIVYLQSQDEEIKTMIAGNLGDKTTIVTSSGDRLVTWKPMITKRLDTKKVKEMHPTVYEAYLVESESRPMRFL